MSTLHIVDGQSTGGTLRLSGLAKRQDILVWLDALYTGPVPAGMTLRQLSRLRSRFWTKGKSTKEFDKRDTALHSQLDFDEVVLWFGSGCTLCELSLIQLLAWFKEQNTPAKRLSRISEEGGPLSPQGLANAYTERRSVRDAEMRMASRVWNAFRSPSPAALQRFAKPVRGVLAGTRKAIRWLLREYPSVKNGLSRLEGELLREIEIRGEAKAAIAVAAIIKRELVGDMLLFDMLRTFVTAPHPLLCLSQEFGGNINTWKFNAATLALTDTGRQVLAGKADHIALNGIDRWIGGVHLLGNRVRWRWDERGRRIVATH